MSKKKREGASAKPRSGAEKAAHLQKHAFKPGQSGNPAGRPKTPEDLLEARNFSREQLERAVLRIVWLNEADLATELTDMDKPIINRIIARIATNAWITGDIKSAGFLLDRAGFPVKKDTSPSTPELLAAMPLDQLLKVASQAFDVLRGQDPLSNIMDVTPDDRKEE